MGAMVSERFGISCYTFLSVIYFWCYSAVLFSFRWKSKLYKKDESNFPNNDFYNCRAKQELLSPPTSLSWCLRAKRKFYIGVWGEGWQPWQKYLDLELVKHIMQWTSVLLRNLSSKSAENVKNVFRFVTQYIVMNLN